MLWNLVGSLVASMKVGSGLLGHSSRPPGPASHRRISNQSKEARTSCAKVDSAAVEPMEGNPGAGPRGLARLKLSQHLYEISYTQSYATKNIVTTYYVV